MVLQTEFQFTLPLGYVDSTGQVHREGSMRRATAMDEIQSIQNPFVQENEAYLPVVLLSRVITRLGELPAITPQTIEKLFASDLVYLENLYLYVNSPEPFIVQSTCPRCSERLRLEVSSFEGMK